MSLFRKHLCAPVLILFFGTVLLFSPSLFFDFIKVDDPIYVTANPHVNSGLAWENIQWCCTKADINAWEPLTLLSYMVTVQFFGLSPMAHHVVNILLHAINSVLLFLILQRLTGATWRSLIVAALFAWHPLHVESVAGISQRKDLLSMFFWLLAVWCYHNYVITKPTKQRMLISEKGAWYAATLLFFSLGLTAKAMVITLPAILLLLDFWPLNRFRFSRDDCAKAGKSPLSNAEALGSSPGQLFREKVPLFLISGALAVITLWAERGSMGSIEHFPLLGRIENAIVSLLRYPSKMFYPVDLAFLYPHPKQWSIALVLTCTVGVLAITLATLRYRKTRFLAVGWLWYVISILPVLGLIQIGSHAMADRYSYIPAIGLFIIVVWGAAALLEKVTWPTVGPALAAGALAGCTVVTYLQLGYWRDTITLLTHTVAVTRANPLAQYDLGCALLEAGRLDEALKCFYEVRRLLPGEADADRYIGEVLARQGKISEALPYLLAAEKSYDQQLKERPGKTAITDRLSATENSIGFAMLSAKRNAEAIAHFRRAMDLNQNDYGPYHALAWVLATCPRDELRNGPEALRLAQRACQLTDWRRTECLGTLDAAYAEAGRFSEAIATSEKVVAKAEKDSNPLLARLAKERLEYYRKGKPYRDAAL